VHISCRNKGTLWIYEANGIGKLVDVWIYDESGGRETARWFSLVPTCTTENIVLLSFRIDN